MYTAESVLYLDCWNIWRQNNFRRLWSLIGCFRLTWLTFMASIKTWTPWQWSREKELVRHMPRKMPIFFLKKTILSSYVEWLCNSKFLLKMVIYPKSKQFCRFFSTRVTVFHAHPKRGIVKNTYRCKREDSSNSVCLLQPVISHVYNFNQDPPPNCCTLSLSHQNILQEFSVEFADFSPYYHLIFSSLCVLVWQERKESDWLSSIQEK